ncbi:hypothetical protein HDU77_009711 [Chytriomyces hyalinus]|nr:hypothetical protein HDU77_009711 [Chytriomyces hyalinus]
MHQVRVGRYAATADAEPDSLEENLSNIKPVNEISLTRVLCARLARGYVHSRIGDRAVVVLNTARSVESVEAESEKRVQRFVTSSASPSTMSVHAFDLVDCAYMHLLQARADQSIMIMAGSTDSTDAQHSRVGSMHVQVVQHLLRLQQAFTASSQQTQAQARSCKTTSRIEQVASTIHSMIGSFFAASFEYQFNIYGAIVGAKVAVVSVADSNPRGMSQRIGQHAKHFISHSSDASNHFSTFFGANHAVLKLLLDGRAVKNNPFNLSQALVRLSFKQRHINAVHSLLAVVCLLTHVSFVDTTHEADSSIHCRLKDDTSLVSSLALLLKMGPESLETLLVTRNVHQPGGDAYTVLLTAEQAQKRRDALVCILYEAVVQWAVMRINQKLCKQEFIGFSHFIQVVTSIEDAGAPYRRNHEGKSSVNIWNRALSKVVTDQIEASQLLKDEGVETRDALFEELTNTNQGSDAHTLTDSHEDAQMIKQLLETSSLQAENPVHAILSSMVQPDNEAPACTSSLFAQDVAASLSATTPWLIAVVDTGTARLDPSLISAQISRLHLGQLAAAAGPKFTASFTHAHFAKRYAACVNDTVESQDSEPAKTCAAIALAFAFTDEQVVIAKTRIFLVEDAWRELEAHLGLEDIKTQETEMMEADLAASMAGDEDESTRSDAVEKHGGLSGLESVNVLKETPAPRRTVRVVEPISKMRKRWICFTWSLTWCIPTLALRICCKLKRPDIQMAWREKVALCIISAVVCSIILFLIIGLGQILCPVQKVLSQGEIDGMNTTAKPVVAMYGAYYLIPDIVKDHVSNQDYLNIAAMEQTTLGHDVSAMFYKTTVWPNYCALPQPSGFDNIIRTIPKDAIKVWYPHQGNSASTGKPIDYVASVAYMRKGMVARDKAWIDQFLSADPANNRLLIAYGNVYDVSAYATSQVNKNFLGSNIGRIISELGGTGVDATQFLDQVRQLEGNKKWADYMGCLNGLFLTGVIDRRNDQRCLISNYIMLGASAILAVIIGLKFITALQCAGRRNPENHDKFVMIQVPCYTEGEESLRKTFESLLLCSYQDERKLLFVISDGMIVGGGNDRPTPQIVLDVLGWKEDQEGPVESLLFQSLGEGMKQMNRAKVYSGYYAIQGKSMPYIVVAKVGTPNENSRPGNRGKRDTQLLIMRFLSHVHTDAEMSPLELEIVRHLKTRLSLDPKWFEYLLWVDADTEIFKDSINRLVACLIRDSRVIGICGETMVGNEMESWVTAIQVYEYFISHHLSKQFESTFGSVTCLPGCFSMYRIRSTANRTPFLISQDVIRDFSINQVDTLHLKNLLHLGEDRYLTTLMMKHFPGYKLTFSADAKCKTIAPSRWGVFVSQRRRWINSTVHTLLELLLLPQLCGCCMFSMRVVVFLDLFSTLAQPSAIMYFGYLIYSAVSDTSQKVPLFSLIMIAAIYGAQMVIFMLKGEFQHLGWMIIYILAIPIYSFYLPIYSFWHFDDFSWGNTRIVVDGSGERVYEKEEEIFDPSLIPLKKWSDREQELVA